MVDSPVAARALAWSRHEAEALSESVTPFAHGVVYRSAAFPDFAALNVVRVTGDPGWSARDAAQFADQALTKVANRLIIFEDITAGQRVRAGLAELGYMTTRIVWMRHDGHSRPPPPAPDGVTLREVSYADVDTLREAWLHEDFPGRDVSAFIEQSVRARKRLNSRTIAAFVDDEPIGFSTLDVDGDRAEVSAVFVRTDVRGQGIGTMLTAATIDAAGTVTDLWISADDEDRPKDLYARLGFEPVLRVMEGIRLGP